MSKLSKTELRKIIKGSFPEADVAPDREIEPPTQASPTTKQPIDRVALATKLARMRNTTDAIITVDDVAVPDYTNDSILVPVVRKDGTRSTTVISTSKRKPTAEQG